jgi:uncharacterized repeat protein (TIGR03843 family)
MALDPSSEPAPPDPGADLERRLIEAPDLELVGLMRRASNYTFLARLREADGSELLAVYKPARGEAPLWDFPDGTLYRREVAAYRLSRLLGFPHIPPTVVREQGPHGVGALQAFVQPQAGRHFLDGQAGSFPERVWREVALFDHLANNADRKAGHCLVAADGEPFFVDHGLTFHVEDKLRTVIWDFAGEPLPAFAREAVERALAEIASLDELLSRAELARLRRRLDSALEPAWRFPQPTSSWSVPWPPV